MYMSKEIKEEAFEVELWTYYYVHNEIRYNSIPQIEKIVAVSLTDLTNQAEAFARAIPNVCYYTFGPVVPRDEQGDVIYKKKREE